MTPELFATLLRPKHDVLGNEVITVAHNANELRSFIDGTDDDEKGAGWHMDDAPSDLDEALANLEALMLTMGWEIQDAEWGYDPEHPEVYFADFVRAS